MTTGPALESDITKQPLGRVVYFDNAASSWPKPPEVAEAIASFLAQDAANPGRSGHRMANATAQMITKARGMLAALVNAETPNRIIFTHGCTDALNTAIHSFVGTAIDPGSLFHRQHGEDARPHVVSTMLEHKACARPLVDLQRRGLIDLDLVGCDENGFIEADVLLSKMQGTTVMVAVTHASNMIGTIQPVEEIGKRLHKQHPEAMYLVDAAQTVGAIPVDVQAIGADFLAFPGHKGLLGPTGIGGLYVGPRAYPDGHSGECMRTCVQGGTGGGAPTMEMPCALPSRFEPGTPNTVGVAGLIAAMEHAPPEAMDHERKCIERIIDWTMGVEDIRVVGTMDVSRRMGVVSLFFEDGRNPKDVATELDSRFGIACRAGDHCATYAHDAMGTNPMGTLRFSAGPYTSEKDVEALLLGLRSIFA